MAEEAKPVTARIRILDKDYTVRCRPEEEGALQESARYLSGRMEDAQASGRSLSHDRVAVMTALNITFEYLKLRQEKETLEATFNEGLERIVNRLAGAADTQAAAASASAPRSDPPFEID